jgi:MFS family permease
LGLLVSGILLEAWSWRSVFGVNIALAVIALVATLRVIPESADPEAPRLDIIGAGISVVGLGGLVYSIIEASTVGWSSARTVIGILLGIAALSGFLDWERSRPNPLLDPRLFRHRAFTAGTLSITLQFFAFFGFIFLALQYLQLVRGDSPLVAAVSLVPLAIAIMPAARGLAPRLVARAGFGPVCVLGLVLVTAGLLVLSRLGASSTYWLLLAGLALLGTGMGLAMTPATAAITDALPAAKQGVGSAMNDLARELGGALGIAVLGSILQSIYRSHLHPAGVPEPMLEHARSSLALASRLGPSVTRQAQRAFTDGMQNALVCAAIVVAISAVAVALLLRRGRADGRSGMQHSEESAGTAELVSSVPSGHKPGSHPNETA